MFASRLINSRRGQFGLALMGAVALFVLTWSGLNSAFAQDDSRWNWDEKTDDKNPMSRPKPRDDGKPVLIIRARGGDLSAVLADGLATNPDVGRKYHVLRLDNDRGRDNADYVLGISGVLLPREAVGTSGGNLLVMLTLLNPQTGEVVNGDRHIYSDIAAAFKDLADLDEHIRELRGSRGPRGDWRDGPRNPRDPDPAPTAVEPPAWANNATRYDGHLSESGSADGRSSAMALAQAESDARGNLLKTVRGAARDIVFRYYLKRNQRVNAGDDTASMEFRGVETTRREAQPQSDSTFKAWAEVRVQIADTRDLLEASALRIARRIFRDATLESADVQALYTAWLKEHGYVVTDEAAPEPVPVAPPCKVLERRDLGAGWALVTVEVRAADEAAAIALAKDFVMFSECNEGIQQSWENIRKHPQFSGALGSWCSSSTQSVERFDGSVKAKIQLRAAYRAFGDWAARVSGR